MPLQNTHSMKGLTQPPTHSHPPFEQFIFEGHHVIQQVAVVAQTAHAALQAGWQSRAAL